MNSNFKVDYHIHTHYSPCGKDEMTVDNILRTAEKQGLNRIGFSDHFLSSSSLAVEGLKSLKEEIGAMPPSQINHFQTLSIGVEVAVFSPGKIGADEKIREEVDFVLIAPNHYGGSAYGKVPLPPKQPDAAARYILEMEETAASCRFADCIAHPFYFVSRLDACPHISDNELKGVMEIARSNNLAIEINCSRVGAARSHPEYYTWLINFFKICKKMGLKFSLGSDAHSLNGIGRTLNLEKLCQEIGVTESDLWCPK